MRKQDRTILEILADEYEMAGFEDLSHYRTPNPQQELVDQAQELGMGYDDPVNHPAHYTAFPGVEVIQITEHLNFCRGNAVKYLCRAHLKGKELEDLKKAQWYITREIERIESALRAEHNIYE